VAVVEAEVEAAAPSGGLAGELPRAVSGSGDDSVRSASAGGGSRGRFIPQPRRPWSLVWEERVEKSTIKSKEPLELKC
jgi:hypothetical protein